LFLLTLLNFERERERERERKHGEEIGVMRNHYIKGVE
jgi:hypothetical protein